MPSVGAIVDFAQAASLPAIALTDTNSLRGAGAIEFISASRKVGIASTPALYLRFVQVSVIGAELALTGGHSIVLLAQNMQGYGNLCRLVKCRQASPDCKVTLACGLSLTDLAPHTDGLIAVSGGCIGPLVRACVRAISHKPNPSHRRWPRPILHRTTRHRRRRCKQRKPCNR